MEHRKGIGCTTSGFAQLMHHLCEAGPEVAELQLNPTVPKANQFSKISRHTWSHGHWKPLMEAFQLLSRGGARFDKQRFKSDVQLFAVGGQYGW